MAKLAVLCDRVSVLGGAERYWQTVIPGLLERRIDVRVFGRIVDAPSRFRAAARAIAWGAEDEPTSPAAAEAIAAELSADPPDAIVTANVFDTAVLDAVRASSARWVVRVHDHRAFCPTGDRVYPQFERACRSPMGAACRIATLVHGCVRGPRPSSFRRIAARERVRDRYRQADRVLVSSEYMRETCVANGIDPSRITITPPPLPDEAYAEAPAKRPSVPTILFASRLTARKGLRSLVRALATMPPAERPQLVIAGEGAGERASTDAQAKRNRIAPEWHGRLAPEALRAAIDAADMVALPSLWPEPFGLVGIEAQARGRPAVAYRTGGIPEWIDGAGFAVPRGDERALAAAIRRLLQDREWERCADAARRAAERYRLGPHCDHLQQVFFSGDAQR